MKRLWKPKAVWNAERDCFVGQVMRDWEMVQCPHRHKRRDVAKRCAEEEAARRNG